MFFKCIFFHFFIFNILNQIRGLVESPPVEDSAILKTEAVIRSTTNNIFSTLKIKGVKDNTKLKQYSLIHNYFVSLTLQDYNNLKEITKLSRVNKNIDNGTQSFIAVLNNLQDEDDSNVENNSTDKDPNRIEDLVDFVTDYVKKLDYLKDFYAVNGPNFDVNNEILTLISNDDTSLLNATKKPNDTNKTNDENIFDENEFWEPSGRRIYRGKTTKIKYFPFMAIVQFFNKFQCGGSIIKDDLVITAASCLQLAWNNRFYRENPAFLSVRVGSTFYDSGGESVGVLEVYFYPGYNPKNLRHNLAIMRLQRALNLKKKRKVKKIDIDRRASKLSMETAGVTILGWGAKNVGNTIHKSWANRLSYAILDIYMLEDCKEIYSREYVTDKNFCAGFISQGGGACNRDVGGPGVVNGILTGIVSFGSPVCGTPDAPTVFTKLGFYTDWIDDIMDQNVPQSKRKTTTRGPLYTYPTSFFNRKPTTFKIQPLAGASKPIPVHTKPEQTEHDLFKQFLKKMFDSNEIDEYMDLFEEMKHKSKVRKATASSRHKEEIKTIDILGAVEYTTEMGKVDPDSVESDKSEETSIKKPLEPYKSEGATERTPNIDYDSEYDSEYIEKNELEKDIIDLMENTALVNINITNIDATNDKEKVSDKENEDEITQIDDSILTLLYMSDSEKGDNNLEIPIAKGPMHDKLILKEPDSAQSVDKVLVDDNDNVLDVVKEPGDKFRDYTYRNSNWTNSEDMLSEKVLYDILSEAVQLQAKNITK